MNPVIVKTRTTVYRIQQIALDFITYDEVYRRVRSSMRHKMFNCHSCGRHFIDGEKLSLIVTDKGNEVTCHECGVKIKEQLEDKGENKTGVR